MITLLGLTGIGIAVLVTYWSKFGHIFQALKKIETIVALLLGISTAAFPIFLKIERSDELFGYIEVIYRHARQFFVFHLTLITLILIIAERAYDKHQNAWYTVLWSVLGLIFSHLAVLAVITNRASNHVDGEGRIALIVFFIPPLDILMLIILYFQYLSVLVCLSVFILIAHISIGYVRLSVK